jgi:hypothetical protein
MINRGGKQVATNGSSEAKQNRSEAPRPTKNVFEGNTAKEEGRFGKAAASRLSPVYSSG